MKKLLLLTVVALGMLVTSCSKNEDPDPIDDGGTGGAVVVSTDITASTTWTADKIYLLKNNVFVTNNAVLTIQPGTIIKGDKSTKGALIITRGAKIMAEGTAEKPIVFTSNVSVGGRDKGDWGGLVLLGKAPNNGGTSVSIEGVSDATDKAKHGGNEAADNSGILKYVRIEYAGISLGPDNEINGLTLGSVGSGTVIDYVSVYRSGDDAFEFFGGTVNAKHLVSIATWDDDLDTDNGYSGKIQFAVVQRLASTADVSGSNAFESDNNSDGTPATPQTSAAFANITVLGPKENSGFTAINANYQHGAQIRRNSAISINNSVFAGYTEGVFYDDERPKAGGPNSSAALVSGASVFINNLLYGCNSRGNQIKAYTPGALAIITPLLSAPINAYDPSLYAAAVYTDPYKFSPSVAPSARAGVPNFTQIAGSPALTGAVWTDAKFNDAFFEKVAYKGAFGTTDWTQGWVSYNSEQLPYTTPGAVK